MDLQVLIIVIVKFLFKKLYKTISWYLFQQIMVNKNNYIKKLWLSDFFVWFWQKEPEHSEPDRK